MTAMPMSLSLALSGKVTESMGLTPNHVTFPPPSQVGRTFHVLSTPVALTTPV
jgi:hypothetical protein